MLIVEVDRTYRYVLAVDRLWEQSEADWTERLVSEGLPVKDVRKVLHGGRGRMQVEFWEPVSVSKISRVLEAKTSGGERPLKDHIYKVTSDINVRTIPPTFGMEPITLEKGGKIKEIGEMADGQFVLLVLTGKYVGTEVLIGQAEWNRLSTYLEDMGTPYTMGADTSDKETPGEPTQNSPEEPEGATSEIPGVSGKGNLKPRTRPAPKERGFPEFPKRKPLSAYWSGK